MNLIPFQKFSFQINLSQNDVYNKLFEETENYKLFKLKNTTKKFEGKAEHNRFKIKLNINYRSAFNPIAIGRIKIINNNTSIIKATLRLPLLIYLFTILMLIITSSILFFVTKDLVKNKIINYETFFICLGCFLFVYITMIIGFNIHAKKFKNTIKKIM